MVNKQALGGKVGDPGDFGVDVTNMVETVTAVSARSSYKLRFCVSPPFNRCPDQNCRPTNGTGRGTATKPQLTSSVNISMDGGKKDIGYCHKKVFNTIL